MRKNWKRNAAILMTAAMIAGSSFTAFAAPGGGGMSGYEPNPGIAQEENEESGRPSVSGNEFSGRPGRGGENGSISENGRPGRPDHGRRDKDDASFSMGDLPERPDGGRGPRFDVSGNSTSENGCPGRPHHGPRVNGDSASFSMGDLTERPDGGRGPRFEDDENCTSENGCPAGNNRPDGNSQGGFGAGMNMGNSDMPAPGMAEQVDIMDESGFDFNFGGQMPGDGLPENQQQDTAADQEGRENSQDSQEDGLQGPEQEGPGEELQTRNSVNMESAMTEGPSERGPVNMGGGMRR